MDLFFALVAKLLPLYAVMACGYFAGRKVKGLGEAAAFLLIYVISPVVIASGIAVLEMRGDYLLLPVIFYVLCAAAGLGLYRVGRLWNDSTRNLLGYAGGTANTGYFGLPVALMILPHEFIGVFLLAMMGFTLFENTIGFYLLARGQYTAKESLTRLSRLPSVYGFCLGLLLSLSGIGVPEGLSQIALDFRGAYVVLGALMIGFGLAGLSTLKTDMKFMGVLFLAKFLFWPAVVFALTVFDRSVTQIFQPEVHIVMILLSLMPLPVNAVAFSTQFGVQKEKAASAVFLSTVFALFYIPAVLVMLGYG